MAAIGVHGCCCGAAGRAARAAGALCAVRVSAALRRADAEARRGAAVGLRLRGGIAATWAMPAVQPSRWALLWLLGGLACGGVSWLDQITLQGR